MIFVYTACHIHIIGQYLQGRLALLEVKHGLNLLAQTRLIFQRYSPPLSSTNSHNPRCAKIASPVMVFPCKSMHCSTLGAVLISFSPTSTSTCIRTTP